MAAQLRAEQAPLTEAEGAGRAGGDLLGTGREAILKPVWRVTQDIREQLALLSNAPTRVRGLAASLRRGRRPIATACR